MKKIIIAAVAFMTAFAAWSQKISRAITDGNLEKVVQILNDNPGLITTSRRYAGKIKERFG